MSLTHLSNVANSNDFVNKSARLYHTRFLCQNHVLIICMSRINCSTHTDKKCSQITKWQKMFHLVKRGSQTARNRKHDCHDSCTLAKVSALYPRVVISSLAKRLEKPPFYHSYTSFGVWLGDYYIPLQRFTICHMPSFAKVVRGNIAMLWFPGVVCGITAPLTPCEPRRVTTSISHSSEQVTLPTTSLISKQVVPYHTRGGTCYPRVSTPKTQFLVDSSMTNHEPWRSQPSPPFQTLLKPQHRTSPR
jgi:hypothetical protein